MSQSSIPLFMTHHAPQGAWASFTFGADGRGASIDLEAPQVSDSADFLVGVAQDQVLSAFPFVTAFRKTHTEPEVDVLAEGSKEQPRPKTTTGWNYYPPEQITRTLAPWVDTYRAEQLTLRVYTPPYPLPDPEKGEIPPLACCPGVLLELEIDNTAGQTPATGFLGLGWKGDGRIYTVDTAGYDDLSGLGFRTEWMMTADKATGAFTLRGHDLDQLLRTGRRLLHQTGPGALCLEVAPGQKGVLRAAVGFYKEGAGSNGLDTRYYYTRHFASAADVCRCLLQNANRLADDAMAADRDVAAHLRDAWVAPLLAAAIRGYNASTQLLQDADGAVYYNVGEGAYVWRNTMDLAADHLAWELLYQPWVTRNIMDLYIRRYAYRDTVRFRAYPGQEFPGGLSFTHDMGNYFTYSPAGYSGYERETTPQDGCYLYMTTEELLNGIYVLTGYALIGGDTAWAQHRADTASALLDSLEHRDAPTAQERDGVLKAQSTRCGPQGSESTTYDALDHSLMDARGSVYVHVKTIAALAMLEAYFERVEQPDEAARALAMRRKSESALKRFWDEERGCLSANLYTPVDSMVLAAVEPLGMLHRMGLTDRLSADTLALLKQHAEACLREGACVDAATGGLKLSSTSHNTWTSKVTLCLYVLQEVLGIDITRGGWLEELRRWYQEYAKDTTISDQIMIDRRQVVGGCYYPRVAVAALFLQP